VKNNFVSTANRCKLACHHKTVEHKNSLAGRGARTKTCPNIFPFAQISRIYKMRSSWLFPNFN